MIKLNLNELAQILSARLLGETELVVESVSTDSRQAVKNALFFALKGENFDAHDYVSTAIEQGCVAAVVERQLDIAVPQLVVANTRQALGQLGAWLKARIKPKTVAITGSSGKTTVKEMTAKILEKYTSCSERVLYTQGNLNNDIGVPLTLLRLTEQHQFAVVELGANHVGEIAYTVDLVKPDACVVNNVAAAHLEGFGSLSGVVQAKGEIYQGLQTNGIAVVNLAHDYPEWHSHIAQHPIYTFAVNNPKADYWAENVKLLLNGACFTMHTPQGSVEINLPYLGVHNVSNALAAAALAMAVGADLAAIKAGLEQRLLVKGRLYPVPVNERLLLIDDTYNANVDSLKSAVSVLAQYPAFRILAVGDMAELGTQTKACHQEVADFVSQAKLDLVVSFGRESACISAKSAQHFTDKQEMHDFLLPLIQQKLAQNQSVVLLAKGSRRMQMEQLIKMLTQSFHISY